MVSSSDSALSMNGRAVAAPSWRLWGIRASLIGTVASVMLLGHTTRTLPFLYASLSLFVIVYFAAQWDRAAQSLAHYVTSRTLMWRWAFVVWAVASLLWTTRTGLSLGRATTLLQIQVLGWILFDAALSGEGRWIVVAVFMSAVVGAAVILPAAFLLDSHQRARGIFGNPNGVAMASLFGLCAFLSIAPSLRSRVWGVVSHLGALAVVAAIVASASRKGMLGAAVVWASSLVFSGTRRHALVHAGLAASLGLLLYAAGEPFRSYWAIAVGRSALVTRLWTSLSVRSISLTERARFAKEGLRLMWRSPLLGHGLESFVWVSNEGSCSHNNFAELGVSLGIPGILLYYGLHSAVLVRSVITRAWRTVVGRFAILAIVAMLFLDVGMISYFEKLPSLLLIFFAGWVGAKAGGELKEANGA